jgi:N-acetyl-anhydromuramyl-L-alanine amidase AmpD
MVDRIEYLMRLTQDHCEDGDDIANRHHQERSAHLQRGEQLLRIAEGLVELLKRDLRRYGYQEKPTITQQEMPRAVRQGPREAAAS